MQSRKEKGRAPYTKYGKAPFQYSDSYQNWRVAAVSGKEHDRAHWAHQHSKRFAPRPYMDTQTRDNTLRPAA